MRGTKFLESSLDGRQEGDTPIFMHPDPQQEAAMHNVARLVANGFSFRDSCTIVRYRFEPEVQDSPEFQSVLKQYKRGLAKLCYDVHSANATLLLMALDELKLRLIMDPGAFSTDYLVGMSRTLMEKMPSPDQQVTLQPEEDDAGTRVMLSLSDLDAKDRQAIRQVVERRVKAAVTPDRPPLDPVGVQNLNAPRE